MTSFTQDAGMVVPGNGGAAILRDPDHISMGPGPFVMDAATLDGDNVVNPAGEDIGKIEAILLDISKERLESAPGFDEDHWPAMADRRWATDVHAYYDVQPYWEDDLGTRRGRSMASAERYPPLP